MKAGSTLPHGQVGFSDIGDANVRDRIMKLGENDAALAEKIRTLEKELAAIKRKVG